MTLLILLLLFVVCQLIDISVDYNEKTDQNPNGVFHKIIRRIHRWIFAKEDISHVSGV